jgi:hypothetical protein
VRHDAESARPIAGARRKTNVRRLSPALLFIAIINRRG